MSKESHPPVTTREVPRLGATVLNDQQTQFHVWAPRRNSVAVHANEQAYPLEPQANGYFLGTIDGLGAGTQYRYLLDGGAGEPLLRPDPRSRFQPNGVHAASEVVDHKFAWNDSHWQGIPRDELLIYELHIGTFTEAGTFAALKSRLPELLDLGVTAIELLPVADTPGNWNWGYDGVHLFAPRRSYGIPTDFKDLVDACHQLGIAVILDVVYNHLGPEGNYLADFGPYFTRKYHTPWGDALNFDGRKSQAVRQFIVDNVLYWLDEFHLDGLRLDAVHFMFDDSDVHILEEIQQSVAHFQESAGREIHLIAEANVFDERVLDMDRRRSPSFRGSSPSAKPSEKQPLDEKSVSANVTKEATKYAIWCDCLMHAIYSHAAPDLRLTYREYQGATDIATAIRDGFLYTGSGQASPERGTTDAALSDYLGSLILATQTHDSVGNHPHGKRLHQIASKPYHQTAAAIVLLYPAIPMLFMGEEVAADTPFTFFADFEDPRLRKAVDRGRAEEYPQHLWDGALAPSDPASFYNSKCHATEQHDLDVRNWYRDLIALRRQGTQDGWLRPEHFSAVPNENRNLFGFRYRTEHHETIFYAHLTAESVEPPTLPYPANGQVLLNLSAEISDEHRTIRMPANSVITYQTPR